VGGQVEGQILSAHAGIIEGGYRGF